MEFRAVNTFLLDNSAFNEIIKDDAKTDQLIRKLRNSSNRVVLSIDTITENFAGDSQYIVKRIPNFKKIIDSLKKEQFVIGQTVWSWLSREKRNSGRLKNVPTLFNSQRWVGFLALLDDMEAFNNFHQKHEPYRLQQAKLQADLVKSDKNFREKANLILDPDVAHMNLVNFALDPSNSYLRLFASPLGISGCLAKKAISASSEYYKIHRAYIAVLYLRSLGNAISSYDKYPEFKFLQKIKKGNWVDLAIIVQASQFNFLVSNDSDQRGICNFLNSKFIFKAKSIDVDEFFGKLAVLNCKS